MSYEMTLPEVDENINEATLAAWLKQPGDAVEEGEVIAEILTEKANVEISAPVTGKVESLLVEIGETIEVGQVIARIKLD